MPAAKKELGPIPAKDPLRLRREYSPENDRRKRVPKPTAKYYRGARIK